MTDEKRKTCAYEECGRATWGKDEFCIFHSQDIEGKKEEFKVAFWEEFERQKKEEETYNFKGYVFPVNISFREREFEKGTDFSGTQFFADADFADVRFSADACFSVVQFFAYANFERAKFFADADFQYAEFSFHAVFVGVRFSSYVNFKHARFSAVGFFQRVQFSGMTDFNYARFSADVSFFDTRFSEKADFEFAKFSSNADFRVARFSGKAEFRDVQFSADADFSDSQFSAYAGFDDARFSAKANFNKVRFSGKADFNNSQFSSAVDFYRAEFSKYASFINIILEKKNGFKMLDTYIYDVTGLFEFIEDNKQKFTYSNKTEFLPDNFRLILGEMATARYPVISRKIKDDVYLLDFQEKHPKLFKIWWLFADCGRSITRWALWSIFFAFLFGFIFADYKVPDIFPQFLKDFLVDINPKVQIDRITDPTGFTPYYFSIVTFTTLGFGDIKPLNLAGEIWISIEVILGYVMLGGLISILANKLARRS